MKELTVDNLIIQGVSLGIKNLPSIVVNTILWLLTIWIPYFNIGTTIGLLGMIAKLSRGESLPLMEIFNPQYRRYMGEFFLVVAFWYLGIILGLLFFVIPGYVIAIAWSLAPLLVIDKGMDPMEALKTSNEKTYGYKFTIFLGYFLISLAFGVLAWLLGKVGSGGSIGIVLDLVVAILWIAAYIGANAYVYSSLGKQK